MIPRHVILLFALCLLASFEKANAINDLEIYANGTGLSSKTRIIYQNASLNSLWSAINAECSTCHPPSFIQESTNHSSRDIILHNDGTANQITVKKISVEPVDSTILKVSASSSFGDSFTLAPNETKAFTINYQCNIDDILRNNLNGWTLLKVSLLLESSNQTDNQNNQIEFSYQKVCTLELIPSFDVSLVILMSLATVLVFIGTQHVQTMFADQSQSSDEVKPIHAIFFVIFASSALLVFYFLKDYVLNIVTALVCISSVSSCALIICELLEKLGRTDGILHRKVKIPFSEEQTTNAGVISFLISLLIVLVWLFTRNWILNNVIGACVVLLFLRVVRLSSMKVAFILLGLAFFYDIFWVFISKPIFGDSVMAYVATSLDLPLKLQWPHYRASPWEGSCGMLGLGDMVLPGLFVGFCYRYDKARSTSVFHITSVVGYAIGLAVCGFFLVVLQLAQPALLYLVPSTIGLVALVAWKKGMLNDIWVGLPPESGESSQGHLMHNEEDKVTNLDGDGAELGKVHSLN